MSMWTAPKNATRKYRNAMWTHTLPPTAQTETTHVPTAPLKPPFVKFLNILKFASTTPLVCPNKCGASFERDVLEDHMKMCGLQKLQCEFSYAGCGAEFIRNHQKEHINTQKHLALVAAATLRISQEQQQVQARS